VRLRSFGCIGYRLYYHVTMSLTIALDDELLQRAQKRAESLGTTVDEVVRQYVEDFANAPEKIVPEDWVEEFIRLSTPPRGDSKGWKFNRDEIHERR
jgi:hypothetical protein